MPEHEKTIADLEAEIEAQNEFISIIAHQLKTPLAGTKWLFKMMLEGEFCDLSPEQSRIVEDGYKNNERMVALVNELRQAGKTRNWNFNYVMEDIDLRELIGDMIEEILPLAKMRNLPILYNNPDQKKLIRGDYDKVQIILENMMDNAIKYAPEDSEIMVHLSYETDAAVVSIHNDGSTIQPGEEEEIFQKFKRGSHATDSHAGGTGLGLFTARRIAQDHKGTIHFISDPEAGTTVTLSLPFAESEKKV